MPGRRAAGDPPGDVGPHHHVVIGNAFRPPHQVKAQLHHGKGALPRHANVRTCDAGPVTQLHKVERQLLGVGNLPVAVHADGIPRSQVTELARIFGARRHLAHADVEEHFLDVGEGIGVLVPLTMVSAASAPVVFRGGFWAVRVGSALWGLGMGVQESLIPAAVAPMVSPDRRAYAYGLFTGAYGTAWVVGSIVIGVLVDVSLGWLVAFCVVTELAAIPLILAVRSRLKDAE